MINIFRKIRQKLLSNGNSGRYLKYAIGEIFLVVIGILIALSINNWNQNRLDRNLESQYYKRVLEDVREEKLILEATLNYSNQVISHAKEAIAVFENSPDANPDPVQNLVDMYQASQLQDSYSASSTYKELIASGQINLIQNEDLKTALVRFYEVDWTESGVFKLENTYRMNLRGKMPDEIQTIIRSSCNDIYVKSRSNYLTALPDACEITIDPIVARSVVEELRQDESLKKDLRYLIGNETGKQNDVQATVEQLIKLNMLLENITND